MAPVNGAQRLYSTSTSTPAVINNINIKPAAVLAQQKRSRQRAAELNADKLG